MWYRNLYYSEIELEADKMKVKESLFKCYHCRTKSKKEDLIRIEMENKLKKGTTLIRYYHSECKMISELNKKNKEGRTCTYSNESVTHLSMKEDLYKMIKLNKLKMVDQHENEIMINSKVIVTMEAPVTLQHDKVAPYFSKDSCKFCFNSIGLSGYDEAILNERILNCRESEGTHPCIKCPFNKLNYISVFDIGIIENGKYIAAIEVLHTSKIKKYKLDYCIKNDIKLYEIDSYEGFNGEKVRCTDVWWKDEEGKIEISDKYIQYYL